ncbi:hypothetical protein D3C87_1210970 [compost metagenome]
MQLLRQFADGGGLAGAVDANHQNHERLVLRNDFQRLFDRLEHRCQFGLQGFVQRVGVGQLFAGDLLGQALDDLRGSFDADVSGEQTGFEVIEQVVINGFAAEEQAGHALADAGAGFRQALFETGEETGFGFFGARGFDWGLGNHFNRHNWRSDDRCRCRLLNDRSNKRRRNRLSNNRRRLDNRLNHRRPSHLGHQRSRRWNFRGDVWRSFFNQRHRLFRHRQGQPRFSRRSQR